MSTSPSEIAWAAGFFDGEGSTSIHTDKRPHKGGRCIRLHINQVDRRPLDRWVAAVGIGRVTGPYLAPAHRKSEANHPQYAVALFRIAAEDALRIMWPYLSEPKKEQAETVRVKIEQLGRAIT